MPAQSQASGKSTAISATLNNPISGKLVPSALLDSYNANVKQYLNTQGNGNKSHAAGGDAGHRVLKASEVLLTPHTTIPDAK